MAVFVLDTTLLIHMQKRLTAALEWHARVRDIDIVGTTVISVAEVYSGCSAADRGSWDAFFGRSVIWRVGLREARWAGMRRYDLARQGIQVHTPDSLIAGVAYSLGATVVTANVRDFAALGVPVEFVGPS